LIDARNARIIEEVRDTDEPIIVFRAQDKFLIDVLKFYAQLTEADTDDDFSNVVMARSMDVYEWQQANAGRVKVPDLRDEERPGAKVNNEPVLKED
jgi:hypothetical protein